MLRKLCRPFAPSVFPYRAFLLALVIGLGGAAVFVRLGLPLPWMLGPMTACTLASILRLPVAGPALVRAPMTMVVGVLLGAGFSPAMVDGMAAWLPTLLGVAGFVTVAGAACFVYFRRVGGFDTPTAYFAGMPGGLVEMVLVGEANRGDPRVIALIHSTRILMIVFSLPLAIVLLGDAPAGARPSAGTSLFETPAADLLLLAALGIAGTVVGVLLRLPSPYLLGPMLASGGVHLLGLTDFRPPYEIVSAAQLVLGVTLGCRFAETPLRTIMRILLLSLGSTLILVAIALAFAFVMSRLTGLGLLPLLLAYSPGGLTETSLVALALHIDVAFVAIHHICRVVLVMTAAGPLFRLLREKG